ncbi:MAG: membrane protein [Phycisphaerae bacterium]|nr:MAG: membrane protein [Phycisphaerae bacterium]
MESKPNRLISLDAFRGLTIAGMILVNNPGSWSNIFPPLQHAKWHGCTPTDLVFPFFLFIVGVALPFSLAKRRTSDASRWSMLGHIVIRSLTLFLLGLSMYGFPNFRLIGPYILLIAGMQLAFPNRSSKKQYPVRHDRLMPIIGGTLLAAGAIFLILDWAYFRSTGLRVPGVLQRIALCYFFASIIVLVGGIRGAGVAAIVLLIGYALVVASVPAPVGYSADVAGPEGLLHSWVDDQVLSGHLYRARPDPEGLLSTLAAIATTLCGVVTGAWLRGSREGHSTAVGLFVAGNVCILLGLSLEAIVPINKKIWTTTYVIFTSGIALHVLGICYWLIDIRGWKRWCGPLLVFGSNAIVVFIASSLGAKMLHRWKLADEGPSVGRWVYLNIFGTWSGPRTASLCYALAYVLLWLLLMYPLYRRRIFIKV